MTKLRIRVFRTLGVAIVFLCLVSCGSRLNQDNFEKIHEGMSRSEVRGILGKPGDASDTKILGLSGGEAVWKDGQTTITVHFLNDKVVSKRMSKSKTEIGSPKRDDGEDRPEAGRRSLPANREGFVVTPNGQSVPIYNS
ncbi:MAG TPA: hypothetical protein VF428_12855 [Casimicrobiaceae bacterium]